jgi:hypothetical protein
MKLGPLDVMGEPLTNFFALFLLIISFLFNFLLFGEHLVLVVFPMLSQVIY